jgi:hypothetical protein
MQSRRRMNTHRRTTRTAIAFAVAALALLPAGASASPAEDRILPVLDHRTEKAQRLARTYEKDLRELNAEIYHCMPWLDVQKMGIGFYKPRHASGDDRFLSLRVFIEQDPTPAFLRLPAEERAAAMFSRYVRPLLGRMARNRALLADPSMEGFNLNLEWRKQNAHDGAPAVHEGIQVFVDRATAADFLAGSLPIGQLPNRTHLRRWDGDRVIGEITLAHAWDDNFVATYKVANYEPEPGVTCR